MNFILIFLPFLFLSTATQAFDIQGHRGARGLLPENTLPSFAEALEAGADVLELDLQVTKDGELVIYHDFALNPSLCTRGDGKALENSKLICQLSLAELKEIDCGSKPNPAFPRQQAIPNTPIPTLQELFAFLSAHPKAQTIRLNLDIKSNPLDYSQTIRPGPFAAKVVQAVHQSGWQTRVYYSSFDPLVLKEIRKLDPEAKIGFIFDERLVAVASSLGAESWAELLLKIASDMKVAILSPHYTLLTENLVQACKQKGFQVIPWTVNDTALCATLMKMGVDGVITDYPSDLISFRNSLPE